MHIGVYGHGYDVQAEQFIDTLPAPRESMMDRDYAVSYIMLENHDGHLIS